MFPELSHVEQRRSDRISSPTMSLSNSNSSGAVVQKLKQRHWLELAEYVSLVSSAVGSLVVALSGQAFYGVAPLTVALSLNVANRYRLEQQVQLSQQERQEIQQSLNRLEQNAVRAIWLTRQQLASEIASLQHKPDERSEEDALDTAYRSKQVAILTQNVASIQDNLSNAIEEMRQEFRLEIAETQHNLQGVNEQVSEIQQAISTLQKGQPIPPYQPEVDLGLLQDQINTISKENQEIIKPHLKRLILAIHQLQASSSHPLPKPPKPLSKEKN